MGHKPLLARLWLKKDVRSHLNCSMQKWLTSHLANSLPVPRRLCWSCTLFSISTGSTSAGFPCTQVLPVFQDAGNASHGQVEISCRAAQRAGDSQLEHLLGNTRMLLLDSPSCMLWKHLSASAAHAALSEDASLLVRWRKCHPSPKSGKQATKGLTLLLKSHIPPAAVSFHPSPWGLACLSPSMSIPPPAMGEGVNGCGEIQGQSWARVLPRGCSLGSLCGRRRLSQLGKQSRAQGRFAL